MPFNLLLLPLLGGYTFITQWNRTRFSTKRHTGERLLFHAAFAGAVFLVMAFVLVSLVRTVVPASHGWWARHVPFPYAGTSFVAFLLGALSWIPANLFHPREREVRRVIAEWGDHLEILFDRAQAENRQISVTLKGGKVYIGFVLENFDPSYERKYVTLLPVASGYRRPDDHRMVLTTPYSDVYTRIVDSERSDLQPEDFKIVVPVAEVQSANLFDWDAYDEFGSLPLQPPSGTRDVPRRPRRLLRRPLPRRSRFPHRPGRSGKRGRRGSDPRGYSDAGWTSGPFSSIHTLLMFMNSRMPLRLSSRP